MGNSGRLKQCVRHLLKYEGDLMIQKSLGVQDLWRDLCSIRAFNHNNCLYLSFYSFYRNIAAIELQIPILLRSLIHLNASV